MGAGDLSQDPLVVPVDQGDEGPVAVETESAQLAQGVEGRVRVDEGLMSGTSRQVQRKRTRRQVAVSGRHVSSARRRHGSGEERP